MSDEPTTKSDAEDEDGRLERALNRVVAMNSSVARAHVARFGGGQTGEALLKRLDRQYRLALTGSGAAVGVASALPGVGTAVGVAVTSAQAVAALEATMLYVLAYAEATGVEVSDLDRRRVLLMGVLLGPSAQRLLEKVIGSSDEHWGTLIATGVPLEVVRQANRELRGRFFKRYGAQAGLAALGRLAPFGIGSVVGGLAGAASSRAVIKATRKAFAV